MKIKILRCAYLIDSYISISPFDCDMSLSILRADIWQSCRQSYFSAKWLNNFWTTRQIGDDDRRASQAGFSPVDSRPSMPPIERSNCTESHVRFHPEAISCRRNEWAPRSGFPLAFCSMLTAFQLARVQAPPVRSVDGPSSVVPISK